MTRFGVIRRGVIRWSVIRWVTTIVGVVLVGAGAAGVAAHHSPLTSSTASRIAAFTPLLVLASIVGLAALLAARRRLGAVLATVVVAAGVATQVPLYVGSASARADDLVVMQANIYLGTADTDALAATVRAEKVDILTVVELTDAALTRLRSSTLAATLGYSFTHALPDGRGIGIFSRFPLVEGMVLEHFRLGNVRAVADIDGHGRHAVYALHPLPPWPEPAWRWQSELSRLSSILRAETLPTIVGADMNSTWDHRQFRELLRGHGPDGSPGLLDAAELTGAAAAATYPANRRIPPMLGIDHVMTRGGPVPTSLRTVDLPGSDHRGVVATVRLRR